MDSMDSESGHPGGMMAQGLGIDPEIGIQLWEQMRDHFRGEMAAQQQQGPALAPIQQQPP